MNNVLSEPSLVLPSIPTNFEAMAGTSRTDFLRAIFDLLESTKITGITVEASPYDLEALQTQVNQLQADVDAIKLRQVRKISITLTTSAGGTTTPIAITPPLDSINYVVSVQFRAAGLPQTFWNIKDTRTVSQFDITLAGGTGTILTDLMVWQLET